MYNIEKQRKTNVSNRKAALFFLTMAILMVLFFTFQNPEQSRDLSEAVRSWLGSIGINVEYKSLRSNVHILEYFIVGFAVCGFCRSIGWRLWIGAGIAWGIGVIDEGIKVLLPGREFSTGDLIRDFIGVGIAALIVFEIGLLRGREAHG